jgi:hypothetical protein
MPSIPAHRTELEGEHCVALVTAADQHGVGDRPDVAAWDERHRTDDIHESA